MTAPNEFTKSDTLAARELVKARNNAAHWNAIDRGEWDNYGALEAARAEVIRTRAEGVGE